MDKIPHDLVHRASTSIVLHATIRVYNPALDVQSNVSMVCVQYFKPVQCNSSVTTALQLGQVLQDEELRRVDASNPKFGAYLVKNVTQYNLDIDLFWNSTARDAIPIYLNEIFNVWFKWASATAGNPTGLNANPGSNSVTMRHKPLPRTSAEAAFGSVITAIFLSIGFAFIPVGRSFSS
jgi:hypothetical protein